jgi:hypothetical protein
MTSMKLPPHVHGVHPAAAAAAEKLPRKKVLIVNCYFPDERRPVKRSNQVPNAVAPVLLAGYFDANTCEVKLYNEVSSGFLELFAPQLLSWPDMIVLTGLTAAFDRLLHLTAYAKTANPDVIVVAGGHGVRALPGYSRQFFDYTCLGDVEEIQAVIAATFGHGYLAEAFNPRYDLAYWIGRLGYLESSRNCNFQCAFCSLTGVGRKYQVPPLDYLEAQLTNMGKRLICFFQDNQILGSGQKSFRERIERVQLRRNAGQFKYWSGFVTDTFFWEEENIRLARDSGCISVFVGVESFDDDAWLKNANKKQNSRFSQADLLRRSIDGGVLVQYGLVFDPTQQRLAQIHRELDIICENPEIPTPNFIFTATPYPGTPFFRDCVEKGLLLPNTNMRDLEGSTLCLKSLDPQDQVLDFIRRGRHFAGYRRRFFLHQLKFLKRYADSLNRHQKILYSLTAATILAPTALMDPLGVFKRKRPRTHLSSSEILDPVYTPCLPVAEKYRHYFEPTNIIDGQGALNPAIAEDVMARPRRNYSEETRAAVQVR